MPTGYTSQLLDKNLDFPAFALVCARAFGALIMMRDDPLDAEIKPEEPTDYYPKRLAQAIAKVAELSAMSHDQRIAHGLDLKQKALDSFNRSIAEDTATNQKLSAMLEKVNAWNPPTPDHEELKKFMIDQLTISMRNSDYIEQSKRDYETKAPMELFADALNNARYDIGYLAEQNKKEIERVAGRNKWVNELRNSLKG